MNAIYFNCEAALEFKEGANGRKTVAAKEHKDETLEESYRIHCRALFSIGISPGQELIKIPVLEILGEMQQLLGEFREKQ